MSRAGIEKWLKQKGIEPDTIDVEGEYDSDISFSANLIHFKELLKTGKGRRTQKEYDAQWCDFIGGECSRGNKDACIAACRDCGAHCIPTKKKGSKAIKPPKKTVKKPKVAVMKAVKPLQRDVRRKKGKKKGKCKTNVRVKAHKRSCPTGKGIKEEINRIVDDLL